MTSSRERLPYIDAVIKEVLRWWIITPTAAPHRLSQDDIYNGMLCQERTVSFQIWLKITVWFLRQVILFPQVRNVDFSTVGVSGSLRHYIGTVILPNMWYDSPQTSL
jgi:hypothetical protein